MTARTYFERHAAQFDSLYDKESPLKSAINKLLRPAVYRRIELTASLINAMENPTILDIGCGSGRTALLLVSAGASRVHGIDFSGPMLQLARTYVRAAGQEQNISLEHADFFSWDAGTRQWDLAIALGVFDYFDDILPALKKMHQLTNTGVFFSVRHPSLRMPIRKLRYRMKGCPIYFYKKDFIEGKCKEAGFTLVEFADGGGASYFVTAYK